jgi:hypothetical protein
MHQDPRKSSSFAEQAVTDPLKASGLRPLGVDGQAYLKRAISATFGRNRVQNARGDRLSLQLLRKAPSLVPRGSGTEVGFGIVHAVGGRGPLAAGGVAIVRGYMYASCK